MTTRGAILVTVFLFICSANACREGKIVTSYARFMMKSLSPIGQAGVLSLPSRYIAGVHLQRGTIRGSQDVVPIEEPYKLICYNETTAALQSKGKMSKEQTSYEFAFTSTKEVRGLLTLPLQDFFIDIDVEKNAIEYAPEVLGIYLTQPNDTFDIEITEGSDHKDIEKIKFHVLTVAKMVFSRDFRSVIMKEIQPKVEAFLNSYDLLID